MRLLPCLLALLAATTLCPGNPSRTCRILFLGAPPDAPSKLILFDGKGSQPVDLPPMNFSEPYPLPAGDLHLHLLPEAPADPGKIDPKAPSTKLAAGISDCYLLLSSDPSNSVAPVRIQLVDAGMDRFKPGQMLWFNLTPHRVGGVLGSRRLLLNPNSRLIVDAPASGNEDYQVDISYHPPDDPRLRPICRTTWQHDPNSRGVFFVLQEPGKRVPRIMGFPDYRAPATGEASP